MKGLIALILMVLMGGVLLSGCVEKTQTQSIIIAQPPSPASGPIYIANEKGYLAGEGLNATLVPFTSGRLAFQALLAGKADVALVAETPLALAAFQNQTFFIIATMTESPHKLVIRKASKVEVPQDLKGKKVSTVIGSAGQFWMYSYLKANGLTTSDVNVINLQPSDAVSALVKGDIDAFFLWEPYPYLAQKELGNNVTVYSSKGIYTQTFNVVVMQDFAKKNPQVLEKLINALLKSEKFMQENREESVKIVAKNSGGMDEKVLDGIWDDHKFAIVLDQSLLNYLQRQGEWARATKIVPAGSEMPNYKGLIFDETLRKIRPSSVTLQ